jgi:hypothetical protein
MSQLQLTLDPKLDRPRLDTLLGKVLWALESGQRMTLREIQAQCGGSEAGISARIRELRNKHNYTINKRRRGVASAGLWEYWLEEEQ